MFRSRTRKIVCRSVLLLGALLIAPVLAASTGAAPLAREDAARQEGKVVVYTSLEHMEVLKKAFTQKYGVGLDYWRGAANKVMDRTLTEVRFGKPLFDVVATNQGTMHIMKKEGIFVPYLSPQSANFPRDLTDPDDVLSPMYRMVIVGILYNSKLLKPEDVPRGLEDFLNPKWHGRWVIPDPSQHFATAEWLRNLDKLYGNEWLGLVKKLAETRPILVESFLPAAQKIVSGEALAGISYMHHVYIYASRGAPLDYVRLPTMLAEGASAAIAAKALHPNAARLFEDFLISREGMETLAREGEFVAAKGVYPPIKDADKIHVVFADELSGPDFIRWAAEFRTVFGIK